MVDAQMQSAVEDLHQGQSRLTYLAVFGMLAFGAFIGSWFSPWVRSIGFSGRLTVTQADIQYIFSHPNYAPASGRAAVWALLIVLFLCGVASLWSRSMIPVVTGAIAAVAVTAIIIGTSGRVGPDAHAILFSESQSPLTWESRLEPSGWLAISATALLLTLTIGHVSSRPWSRSPRRHS